MVGWLGRVAAWLVILGVVVVLVIAVLIPRVTGATPYTVLTGSMRPGMPPGTLVVVKPVKAQELSIGDVITYQLESGKSPVVTHRITGMGTSLKGEPLFVTQGDANDVADAAPVMPVQIRGRAWYSVPYLGYVNNALTGSQRQIAVYAVAGLLLGYAAWMFGGALRERLAGSPGRDEETKGVK
ncbi:MAG: signal peptidase I [Aeromicrobium sp.]|uniref:signal peptidase I n=1 Tax=Aeromicrobium sp. TaxID=1871063 RepID=UPI0039E31A64